MTLGGVRIVEADPAYDSTTNRQYALSHGVRPFIGINPRMSMIIEHNV